MLLGLAVQMKGANLIEAAAPKHPRASRAHTAVQTMKQTLLALFICFGLLTLFCGAAEPDPALRLWLPLDEGVGTLTADSSPSRLEAELTNVQWAKGAFGTAARFGGEKAFI